MGTREADRYPREGDTHTRILLTHRPQGRGSAYAGHDESTDITASVATIISTHMNGNARRDHCPRIGTSSLHSDMADHRRRDANREAQSHARRSDGRRRDVTEPRDIQAAADVLEAPFPKRYRRKQYSNCRGTFPEHTRTE